MRWLDFDARYLEDEPPSLPAGRYLECETWSGKPVVVPSQYARLIASPFELAQVLQRRPRAEVIDGFVGTSREELSVEVILILIMNRLYNAYFSYSIPWYLIDIFYLSLEK